MKPPSFHFVLMMLSFLAISACKKEHNLPVENATATTGTLPPAGFVFPRTYTSESIGNEFKLWVNDVDRTALSDPSQLFGPVVIAYDISLLNNITCSFGKNADIAHYYFKNDSLYLYDSTATFAIAKGGYEGFVMNLTNFLIKGHTGSESDESTFSFHGSTIGSFTRASLTQLAKDNGVSQIDTLAYFNQTFQYR